MGLLERYRGNVMTWVRPSNYKLIDRAARYIIQILSEADKKPLYEDVVEKIFEESEGLSDNEAIVLKVLERY
jgi:N-acetylmuramic acid 6-phosphate etherase